MNLGLRVLQLPYSSLIRSLDVLLRRASRHPAMICLPQKSLDGKLLLFNLSDFWDRSLFP